MKDFVLNGLRIDVTYTPGKLRLDWSGISRVNEPELAPFLTRISEDVLGCKATLDLHFEQTTYFNATTIVAVIRFVKNLCERNIGIQISFDPKHRWQKVFVDTMWMFDKKDGRFKLQPV